MTILVVLTAALFTVLAAIVLYVGRGYLRHQRLQSAADALAVAAAAAARANANREVDWPTLQANIAAQLPSTPPFTISGQSVIYDVDRQSVVVGLTLNSSHQSLFSGLGLPLVKTSAKAKAAVREKRFEWPVVVLAIEASQWTNERMTAEYVEAGMPQRFKTIRHFAARLVSTFYGWPFPAHHTGILLYGRSKEKPVFRRDPVPHRAADRKAIQRGIEDAEARGNADLSAGLILSAKMLEAYPDRPRSVVVFVSRRPKPSVKREAEKLRKQPPQGVSLLTVRLPRQCEAGKWRCIDASRSAETILRPIAGGPNSEGNDPVYYFDLFAPQQHVFFQAMAKATCSFGPLPEGLLKAAQSGERAFAFLADGDGKETAFPAADNIRDSAAAVASAEKIIFDQRTRTMVLGKDACVEVGKRKENRVVIRWGRPRLQTP